MPGSFFDSNVILYLVSSDSVKVSRVEQLLAQRGSISVQVLNESANVLRRRREIPWPNLPSARGRPAPSGGLSTSLHGGSNRGEM